jgi:hypothetical protein
MNKYIICLIVGGWAGDRAATGAMDYVDSVQAVTVNVLRTGPDAPDE